MTDPGATTPHPLPDHRAALAEQQRRFLELAAGTDPAAPVPGCPGWRAGDLVDHVAGVYRWAAATAAAPPGTDPPGPGPTTSEPLTGLADAARDLLAVLDEAPDAPCATFAGTGRRRDWARRQLHETLLHTWDLADASGRPRRAERPVVADAVAEVLDVVLPRQVRLGRTAPPAVAVALVGSRRWRLGSGPLAGTVTGPDVDLLRLLWRRTDLHGPGLRLDVTPGGDPDAVAALLRSPLTP